MKFVTNITLRASDHVAYTAEVVEELLDALHDIDYLEEVDAGGSLANHKLILELLVEADDIDEAHQLTARAVSDALDKIGGELVGRREKDGKFRKTDTATREMLALA